MHFSRIHPVINAVTRSQAFANTNAAAGPRGDLQTFFGPPQGSELVDRLNQNLPDDDQKAQTTVQKSDSAEHLVFG